MRLSIILPTYNRAAILDATLCAYLRLDIVPGSWELLVVDNASQDDTKQVVEKFGSRLPIVYLHEPRQGKNHANNRGIEHATGDVLVFTDDDITPSPNWLTSISAAISRWPGKCFFGGRVNPLFPPYTWQGVKQADFSSYVFGIHDLGIPEGEYPCGGSPVGANCWMRRDVFRDGWRYDGSIGPNGRGRVSGSELEFFTRLLSAGYRAVYVPDAAVQHRIESKQTKLPYLIRRAYASGRGQARIFGFPPECKRIGGVPRYLYREILEYAASSASMLLTMSPACAFERIMKCSVLLGAIRESRENRESLTDVSKCSG